MRREFFLKKAKLLLQELQEFMKLRFPKFFAHVPAEGLEAWAGLIRKEVAEEGICLPVGSLVEAENKEGKVKVIRISWRPAPLPFPLFLRFLSQP